ncbi:quinon protein alcohol dehydrogenase-like superfamily [Pavlovales sp. CCMP2436]|nr:quinon protein alcohol dehydrogenase-like superfamily [Pavlovales sp. CCMP2436]
MSEGTGSPLELEHLIGYAGLTSQSAQAHASDAGIMVYAAASLVVLASATDPHQQKLLRGHTEEVTCLEQRLIVWDLQNGQAVNVTRHEAPITFIAFGPVIQRENRRGASRPSTYRLAIGAGSLIKELSLDFNVKSMQFELVGTAVVMPNAGLHRAYSDGTYAPGDQFLLAATRTGELCVFALSAEPPAAHPDAPPAAPPPRKPGVFRACVPVSSGAGGVHSLVTEGEYVWLGAGDGKVKRFRGSDQSWQMEAETLLEGRVVSLSLTADRQELIAATSAGVIYSLHAGTLRFTILFSSHTQFFFGMAWWRLTPFFYAGVGEYVNPHHVPAPSGAVQPRGFVWSIAQAHKGPVSALALTETALVTAGQDGKVRVWSLGSRRCEAEIAQHTKSISAMVVDVEIPTRLHTCGLDQLVVTYDMKKQQRVTYHALREGQFTSMVQRPQGDMEILTATHDGFIFVWDVDETCA